MYSCCNIGRNTRTKVIVLSVIGVAVVGASYLMFTATNNGAVLALSGLLGFAACPAMCAAMGGIMWVASRLGSKKNENVNSQQSCCGKHATESQKEEINSRRF